MTRSKRIYVLDTNVLMHDPTALFKFEEHDVFLPMQVIEELDNGKKGTSEASRNARQVSRFLNELIEAQGADKIDAGITLQPPAGPAAARRAEHRQAALPDQRDFDAGQALRRGDAGQPDPRLRSWRCARPTPACRWCSCPRTSTCASRRRSPASPAEDYENDRALDDFSLLYTGATALPEDFWQRHGKDLRSWTEKGRTYLRGATPRGRRLASEPVPVPARRRRRRAARRAARRRQGRRCRSSTTTAATSTRCGASPRATASRTSRSTR